MKYSLLAQWVNEWQSSELSIAKILINPENVILVLREDKSIVFRIKSSDPLLYITTEKFTTSDYTAAYWQLLNNARISEISIAPNDRIIYFDLIQKDIYQKTTNYSLIFECMPPHANLILCENTDGKLKITDAVNKYTYADNPMRQILPHLDYETPRTSFQPQKENILLPLTIIPLDGSKPILCTTVNDYLIAYDIYILSQRECFQKKQNLATHWRKELTKAEKKLRLQQAELLDAAKEKLWLTYSELLKVNLNTIRKGDTELQTINYYDPEMQQIAIPLLTDKNPQDNLKFYLKKYRKAKSGRIMIEEQIHKTMEDIESVKDILVRIEADQWHDVEIPSANLKETLAKLKQTDTLFRLPINGDWEIVIGRKAKENDLITTQIAKPNDWWFHTRIYHGSHILLRNYHKKEPSPILINLCCGLAAGFSKAKNSQNVPVDYTQIRYVRKPRKSAPGYVTYTNQKTVFVNPIDVATAKEIIAATHFS